MSKLLARIIIGSLILMKVLFDTSESIHLLGLLIYFKYDILV